MYGSTHEKVLRSACFTARTEWQGWFPVARDRFEERCGASETGLARFGCNQGAKGVQIDASRCKHMKGKKLSLTLKNFSASSLFNGLRAKNKKIPPAS
jgi:hypothetical protein